MLYDDIVAEFRWSPEQMSAPFDLRAADEMIRKKIESRRGTPQAAGRQQRPRARQSATTSDRAVRRAQASSDKA
ncbi:hypothetical protein J2S40_001809 [Nocardioides luteus]|uniref:Uncharacterized protein n=1 Tax=Nocardioides luteus TaxID=1844 RepID=A0ABQ5T062_9ACTN|nr:hypothetical protein [Nocardioides luteus]MDR7310751.1 hypothetical protein [Nocardioides luteus]GGR40835.1 hypothetical protein GCM10010197_02450 [Nocardioides luteus]GLJ69469.1 hypothetical protein GCM10017579_35050 [Nocardioides luteus]